jgi:hypothetical protein
MIVVLMLVLPEPDAPVGGRAGSLGGTTGAGVGATGVAAGWTTCGEVSGVTLVVGLAVETGLIAG